MSFSPFSFHYLAMDMAGIYPSTPLSLFICCNFVDLHLFYQYHIQLIFLCIIKWYRRTYLLWWLKCITMYERRWNRKNPPELKSINEEDETEFGIRGENVLCISARKVNLAKLYERRIPHCVISYIHTRSKLGISYNYRISYG